MLQHTHVCFESVEFSGQLIARTAQDLAGIAATPGFSLETKGFSNLALLPRRVATRLADFERAQRG